VAINERHNKDVFMRSSKALQVKRSTVTKNWTPNFPKSSPKNGTEDA